MHGRDGWHGGQVFKIFLAFAPQALNVDFPSLTTVQGHVYCLYERPDAGERQKAESIVGQVCGWFKTWV
jgi:hypothetical protein